MKERPILFSGPMVRAILDGRKTQTRRLVSPQPSSHHYLQPMWGTSPPPNPVDFGEKNLWREAGPDYPDDDSDDRRCPFGVPGDRLWVRETWAGIRIGKHAPVFYRASCENDACDFVDPSDGTIQRVKIAKWRPAIFLPRGAHRITLEVTEVRVQRLNEISEGDARAEGIQPLVTTIATYPSKHAARRENVSYLAGFAALWDRINGKRAAWSSDPWVWAISFRRLP